MIKIRLTYFIIFLIAIGFQGITLNKAELRSNASNNSIIKSGQINTGYYFHKSADFKQEKPNYTFNYSYKLNNYRFNLVNTVYRKKFRNGINPKEMLFKQIFIKEQTDFIDTLFLCTKLTDKTNHSNMRI